MLLVLVAMGCGDDAAPTRDGGVDAGRTATCGDVGLACCAGRMRCMTGSVCGSDRSCCAVPGGSACETQTDCCGALDCVAGACCVLPGMACRQSSECCGDAICNDENQCELPADDCGTEREVCCEGDVCRSGLSCVEDTCVPCGEDAEICCRPPDECEGDMSVCTGGMCGPAPGDCGRDAQPCCEGTSCVGALTCDDGTCRAPPEDCSGYDACTGCTAAPGSACGWCGATGTCMEGDVTGPTMGSCASGWEHGPVASCDAMDSCPDNGDCRACTLDSSFRCGWCATAGSCHRGRSSGPDDGTCMGADWKWLPSACTVAMDSCPGNTDCGSCARDSSLRCGWCADTGSCHRGTSSGPTDATCMGTDWRWLASQCVDPCNALTACGACIDTTDGLDCGFCASDMSCRTGTVMGPATGSCADWRAADCTGFCGMVTEMCSTDTDCCTGTGLSCRSGATFPTRCCQEAATSCAMPSDCCGFMDCSAGMCQCRTAGRACLDTRDCCTGLTCSGGVCA